jgi:hypothetical protein
MITAKQAEQIGMFVGAFGVMLIFVAVTRPEPIDFLRICFCSFCGYVGYKLLLALVQRYRNS